MQFKGGNVEFDQDDYRISVNVYPLTRPSPVGPAVNAIDVPMPMGVAEGAPPPMVSGKLGDGTLLDKLLANSDKLLQLAALLKTLFGK